MIKFLLANMPYRPVTVTLKAVKAPGARTLLASPLVAAAAAVTGVITDPRTFL